MTITKEGALASFYTVNKAPIKHLKVYFSPKQAGSGDPSPENVREISGWDQLTYNHTTKSIISFLTQEKQYNSTNIYNGYGGWCTQQKIPDRTKTYIYSVYINNTNGIDSADARIWHRNITNSAYVDNTVTVGNKIPAGSSGWSRVVFNVLSKPNTYYMVPGLYMKGNVIASNPIIEIASTASEYEPYKGSMQTIDWSNDIGTVYGGYVDLITGELIETWGSVDLGSINTWYIQTYENSKWFRATLPTEVWQNTWRPNVASSLNNHPPHFLIDRFKIVSGASIYYGTSGDNVLGMDWLATIRIKCDSYNDDIDAFKAAINGKILYYEYATPITYQLTPQQLQTFIGRNNIWSNADRVEVEYDLAESNDELYRRRNIILSGYPHIETTSGNIANFQTDMAAPLKEAKIYFNPVQEGEGDPSPDNVRNINGWTGIDIAKSGTNLLNIETSTIGYKLGSTTGQLEKNDVFDTSDYIPMQGGQTLYLKNVCRATAANCLFCYDKNKNYILDSAGHLSGGENGMTNGTLITAAGTAYIRVVYSHSATEVAVNYPLTNTSYYTYSGQIIPIDWTSNGTIYGGYVDLINGQLTKTWNKVIIDGSQRLYGKDSSQYNGTLGTDRYISITNSIGANYLDLNSNNTLCDKLQLVPTGTWSTPNNYIGKFTINARYQLHFVIDNTVVGITSEDTPTNRDSKISIWLAENPITVVYKTQTTNTYQLTPQQIKTLKGINNIWSNARNVEVKYWTH